MDFYDKINVNRTNILYMSRQFKWFLLRVLLLTTAIVTIFNIWDNFINAKTSPDKVETINENVFKKVNSYEIWKTWVAISTNLWIRYKERNEIPATIYSDIFSINELKNNSDSSSDLIADNMIVTNEYRNVLKTDIKKILNNSTDKAEVLNAIIEQLEFRYEKATIQVKNLNSQKDVFESEMEKANTQLAMIKSNIDKDFKADNAKKSVENIEEYLKAKNDYYYARTYIIYINQFLREYAILNNYNKKLLDTLINNKDALIKDAFVVIPDSWAELLRNFDLLYTEENYKSDK